MARWQYLFGPRATVAAHPPPDAEVQRDVTGSLCQKAAGRRLDAAMSESCRTFSHCGPISEREAVRAAANLGDRVVGKLGASAHLRSVRAEGGECAGCGCAAVQRNHVGSGGTLLPAGGTVSDRQRRLTQDRKSTRLNSSHSQI